MVIICNDDVWNTKRLSSHFTQGSKKSKFSLADVGRLISDLTGDFYQPLYLQQHYKSIDPEKLLTRPLKHQVSIEDDLLQIVTKQNDLGKFRYVV